jgi:hypothetical protein
LAKDLRDRGQIDLSEAFVDVTRCSLGQRVTYKPNFVPGTLDTAFSPTSPTRLIGGRGCDGDRLNTTLTTTYGIEMIAANRRARARTQDGRPSRVCRRWKPERIWLGAATSAASSPCWKGHLENYVRIVQLACARILLQGFMK